MTKAKWTQEDWEDLSDNLSSLLRRHRNLVEACNLWKQEILYITRGQRSFTAAEERILSYINEEQTND